MRSCTKFARVANGVCSQMIFHQAALYDTILISGIRMEPYLKSTIVCDDRFGYNREGMLSQVPVSSTANQNNRNRWRTRLRCGEKKATVESDILRLIQMVIFLLPVFMQQIFRIVMVRKCC